MHFSSCISSDLFICLSIYLVYITSSCTYLCHSIKQRPTCIPKLQQPMLPLISVGIHICFPESLCVFVNVTASLVIPGPAWMPLELENKSISIAQLRYHEYCNQTALTAYFKILTSNINPCHLTAKGGIYVVSDFLPCLFLILPIKACPSLSQPLNQVVPAVGIPALWADLTVFLSRLRGHHDVAG
jgi:hypothetical protein